MNFQQLRYARTALEHKLNLTEVANRLCTSHSGVSKQIKEREAELKVDIFMGRGKRLTGLAKAGGNAAQLIDKLLNQADNLNRLTEHFVQEDRGRFVVATTHNHANHVLPPILLGFELRQGALRYAVEQVLRGEAHIGVATEAVDDLTELETHPCFGWKHVVIAPSDHALAKAEHQSPDDAARYPIITYNRESHAVRRSTTPMKRRGWSQT